MKKIATLVSFLVLSGCTSCLSIQDTEQASLETGQKAIDYVAARTVHVQIHRKLIKEDGSIYKDFHMYSYGSGTIFKYRNGKTYILTAAHVVEKEEDTLLVQSKEGIIKLKVKYAIVIERRNLLNVVIDTAPDGHVDALDKASDLAVVSVYYYFGIKNTRIAKESKLGEVIYTMGYPHLRGIKGIQLSFSKGRIETANIPKEDSLRNMPYQIRISTSNYFGSSGGGVINERGEITAVVCLMTGFRSYGGFAPQQGTVYGPGAFAIRDFLKKHYFLL